MQKKNNHVNRPPHCVFRKSKAITKITKHVASKLQIRIMVSAIGYLDCEYIADC